MAKKILQGVVVSRKMQNTIVVRVSNIKQHSKYKKRFKTFKNYKAHCQTDKKPEKGEIVFIEETKPISKDKKWILKKTQKND